ncbi:MAG: lytic murein transglycosylase B [Gammaproteobacteria bacterium]
MPKKHLKIALILNAVLLFTTSTFAQEEAPVTHRAEVCSFIEEMVAKHDFDKEDLQQLFQQAVVREDIIQSMDKPSEAKPWFDYQKLFVTEKRTQQGVEFWQQHENTLARAEREYGVPASIVVAILGVETNYGEIQGNHRVIDALFTLSFEYPRRADFFKNELEEFLLLSRENKFEPDSVLGSYAGAIGQAQFMPSSYRNYAIDFTDSGNIDLRNEVSDAIGSIANYLKTHGWKAGQPIVTPIETNDEFEAPNQKQLKPTLALGQLKQQGIQPQQKLPDDTLATFITLDGEDNHEHWLGFQNFYTITRYNTSELYAMAVYQLAEEISEIRLTDIESTPHSIEESSDLPLIKENDTVQQQPLI